jgi:hypothetical protein
MGRRDRTVLRRLSEMLPAPAKLVSAKIRCAVNLAVNPGGDNNTRKSVACTIKV